ncbi:MAG: hypothetical protein F6K31_24840 [Symploca sp. SIO2G7]|nr:hypothetical protein [Symploca sp. SIO2G7]NEP60190.1 hypothetical protein [Symploca sp. SIO2G7]
MKIPNNLTKLAVNHPSPLPPRFNDGLCFEWNQNSPFILMYMSEPRKAEIAGLKKKTEFALTYKSDIIFLLLRAANNAVQWSEAPFSLKLYNENDYPTIPSEITEESRLAVLFILIEVKSNVIKMLKQCTFSPSFTQELYKYLVMQRNSELTPITYNRTIQEVYSQYTPEQLVEQATARCFAGG